MAPELRLIRYFVAVAQEGNVTRAAERLHVAQPSLSAAVRQLEAQLGVDLLERTGRGVALTPAGELLLAAAASCSTTPKPWPTRSAPGARRGPGACGSA